MNNYHTKTREEILENITILCKECKKEMWYHEGNHFCFDCQRLV